MISKPKIGVLAFSDGDPEAFDLLKPIVDREFNYVVEALRDSGEVDLVLGERIVNSVEVAKEEAQKMVAQNVDGMIFSYGVFAFPNFSAIAAKFGKGPFMLVAGFKPDWPGMVAMLAAGGALHHLGIEHFRTAGDVKDPAVLQKLLDFAKCARVVNRLKGSTYGLIGGRSLGMYSATVSMQQWQDKFGIDIEHVDQSEIIRLAEQVPEETVEKAFQWLTDNVAEIKYDGDRLTPEKLKTQIRHYEATKMIRDHYNFDFLGVKCHYEMSKHVCTQCLTAAFMNDPYDWNGPKEPTVMACEADSDAALTMQILKLLTEDPVLFMDVRHYDADYDVMVFCNCGSESTYYAGRSDDYKENLKNVTLYPCLDLYPGGGCHVNCMTAPGQATIARLNRYKDRYRMTIIPVEFVTLPREKMKETTEEWPHVFAKLPFDHDLFIQKFDANHCHAVYGDHVEELKTICQMLDVDIEVLGE